MIVLLIISPQTASPNIALVERVDLWGDVQQSMIARIQVTGRLLLLLVSGTSLATTNRYANRSALMKNVQTA